MDGRLIIDNTRRETGDKLVSKSPATLEPIGEVSLAASPACREAVLAAKRAFPAWRDLPLAEKKKVFRRAKLALLRRSDEAARLISIEKGSPFMESMAVEVLGSLETVDYYARHLDVAVRPHKSRAHQPLFAHKKNSFRFQPLGPTLPIMSFRTLEEAVALANDCVYGLTASVWTRSRKTAGWLAERIEAGTVTVNDHMFSFTEPKAIWGGIKQTGMGRSHGLYGLHHLVNNKYVSMDFAREKGALWWYPYRDPKPRVIRNALTVLHQEGIGRRFKAALALLPSLKMIRAGLSVRSLVSIAGRLFRR